MVLIYNPPTLPPSSFFVVVLQSNYFTIRVSESILNKTKLKNYMTVF